MKAQSSMKDHVRLIIIILFSISIFSAAILYFTIIQKKEKVVKNIQIEGTFFPKSKPIANFELTDNQGKAFGKDKLKGHWTMMFFGFTNCGYVCPTTMAELSKMYNLLQGELSESQMPQVVFVTVDPERDTIARMNDYIKAFNTHFIGARAEIKETLGLENQLHIAAIKMQAEGQGSDQYMINHSSEVILFNPTAEVQAYFSFPPKAEKLAKDYKLILKTLG